MRIGLTAFFLLLVLMAALAAWLWPHFSHLDAYRPQIVTLLTQALHRPITIGHLDARLLPQPSLVAREVTVFYPDQPTRPFVTSAHVAMRFYGPPLWHRQLRPRVIAFEQPRLFLTHDTTSWATLWGQSMPVRSTAIAHVDDFPLERLEVIDGIVALSDKIVQPAQEHRIEQLSGSFEPMLRAGEFQGNVPSLGPTAHAVVHIQFDAEYPIDIAATGVHLRAIAPYAPKASAWLFGVVSGRLKVKSASSLEFTVDHLTLGHFPNVAWRGAGQVQGERLAATFDVLGSRSPMHGDVHCLLRGDPIDIQASIDHYSPELTPQLTAIPWITRLEGPGHAELTLRRSKADRTLDWVVDGGDFGFSGTTLRIASARVSGSNQKIVVDAHLKTEGGTAQVVWSKPVKYAMSTLRVSASSMTVREVLPVFHLAFTDVDESTGVLRARAWQDLALTNVKLRATITPHASIMVRQATMGVEEAELRMNGMFGLQGRGAPAHVQGRLTHVALESMLARFFRGKPAMTGTTECDFDLDFPLINTWIENLDGNASARLSKGVIRSFKTLYDVLSVLNLTNYLTLHLPQFHEEGIPYQSIVGHFTIDNGVFTTQDVFMKTDSSNVAVEGDIDFPGQEIDATVRIQFFRLIEDLLRAIPGVNWIIKNKQKILLPMTVRVRGPWKKVEVE